jgi:hypothetical protein
LLAVLIAAWATRATTPFTRAAWLGVVAAVAAVAIVVRFGIVIACFYRIQHVIVAVLLGGFGVSRLHRWTLLTVHVGRGLLLFSFHLGHEVRCRFIASGFIRGRALMAWITSRTVTAILGLLPIVAWLALFTRRG